MKTEKIKKRNNARHTETRQQCVTLIEKEMSTCYYDRKVYTPKLFIDYLLSCECWHTYTHTSQMHVCIACMYVASTINIIIHIAGTLHVYTYVIIRIHNQDVRWKFRFPKRVYVQSLCVCVCVYVRARVCVCTYLYVTLNNKSIYVDF